MDRYTVECKARANGGAWVPMSLTVDADSADGARKAADGILWRQYRVGSWFYDWQIGTAVRL